jgi:hypothetical protein
MEIVYASGRTEWQKGRMFGNARLFHRTIEGVERVIVVGDWPNIVEAYRRIGVPVRVVGTCILADLSQPKDYSFVSAQCNLPIEPEPRPDAGSVEIPAAFRDLKWKELRALSKQLSDTPAINSKEALAIIEAEVERRRS